MYTAPNTTTDLTIPTISGVTTVSSVNNWLVIQQRIDSTVSFSVGWSSYKTGFGTNTGNYWMGLEKIYRMTNVAGVTYKLRIEYLVTSSGKWFSEEYDTFKIDSEATFYVLHVPSSGYTDGDELFNSGLTGVLNTNNGYPFSTSDKDNDNYPFYSCASSDKGGWWYNACTWINLNGDYSTQFWITQVSYPPQTSLTYSRMMIKQV